MTAAPKRITALLLALLLLVSLFPTALAEEESEAPLPELTDAAAEMPEEPDAEPGLPADATEDAESAEGAEPAEEADAEPTEEIPEPEEAGPAEEPEYADGFAGMPDGYALSEAQLADKRELQDNHIAEAAAGMTPGEDYAADEVFFLAETREYAEQVAAAYNADLKSFSNGVAVLTLRGATVAEAVAAAADDGRNLPMVEPNYIVRGESSPADPVDDGADYAVAGGDAVPVSESWQAWYEGSPNPDRYLVDPTSDSYPYFHDVVNTYEAWDVARGSGVTVALLDSGVNPSHEDLPDVQVLPTSVGTANLHPNATGYAGILGAEADNGKGVAGVAPEVTILSVRVLDAYDSGPISTVIEGLNAVVEDGRADVVNMSFTDYYYTVAYKKAIQNIVDAGMTVVADMGWNGSNIKCYPAAFNIPGVIAVGLATKGRVRSVVSNYGAWEDTLAPGTYIYSTAVGGRYAEISGSGCPVVSGVCALYMSAYGHQTPQNMEKVIRSAKTGGIIDAAKLFTVDRTAPVISVPGSTVPYGSVITISAAPGAANGAVFVYTLNGKNPSVKGGVTVNGSVCDGSLAVTEENGFVPGKKVTLKAACVSGIGVLSKVATVKFTVGAVTEPGGAGETGSAGEEAPENAALPASGGSAGTLAEAIEISGPRFLAAGKSATYKAAVSPSTAANKAVVWSVEGLAGAKITAAGKLTAPKGVTGTVTVTAAAKDGSGVTAAYSVEVREPVRAVRLLPDDALPTERYTLNKNGTLKQATLFSYEIDEMENGSLQLLAEVTGPQDEPLSWRSSKPAVASVDETGLVTALSAGKAVITCAATDGSGTKSTVTIRVLCPASSVTVVSSAKAGHEDAVIVAAPGKTVKNRAVLGDAFGTPSIKKVVWDFDVTVESYDGEDEDTRELILTRKWISVNRSSGKLTVKKDLAGWANTYDIYIDVYAATTDGTELEGSIRYFVETPYAYFTIDRDFDVYNHGEHAEYGSLPRGTSGIRNPSFTVSTYNNLELVFTIWPSPLRDKYAPIEVKSSNPNVAGAEIEYGDGWPKIHIFTNSDAKTGTAKITVRGGNGSKAKINITVKVK